ncbi:hypothetical protein JVU11DRAFT_10297 [Chiua virens]|nr:hypothetical protein JVU11DRAFT_10297 [Chiua virens]
MIFQVHHHILNGFTLTYTSEAIPSGPQLTRTTTTVSISESVWHKRKPTHLPPILKFATSDPTAAPESPRSPVYHRSPSCRSCVLSDAPSVVSSVPLTGLDAPSTCNSKRRSKLERLRRKLGEKLPVIAVFTTTFPTAVPLPGSSPLLPPTPKTSKSRTRSVHHLPDDARSLTFSLSSDESVHTVTFTTAHVRPPKTRAKNVYHTGALPPVPPIPAHLVSGSKSRSTSQHGDDHDGAGLIRPRQKMGAGSKIGGSDFKAARRAKRDGRSLNDVMATPGEMVEMVGFL